MSIRDRVKQAATVTSATVITLDGAADTGMLTFEQAFQMPTVAQRAGTIVWNDVPVLIERSDGSWGTHAATLQRSGTGVVTVQLAAAFADLIQSSSPNAITRAFDGYGLTPAETVTVTLGPSAAGLGNLLLRGRKRFSSWTAGEGTDLGSYDAGPYLAANGLVALGDLAAVGRRNAPSAAEAEGSIAIGDLCTVGSNAGAEHGVAMGYWCGVSTFQSTKGAVALGYRNNNNYSFSAVVGGLQAYTDGYHQRAIGNGSGVTVGSGVSSYVYKRDGVQQAVTTNATTTKLRSYDETGAAISFSEDGFFCDIGVMILSGTITAFQPSTGVRKAWRVEALFTNNGAYNDVTVLGTPTITEILEQAGSETWAVAAFANDAADGYGFEVTGEAAKTIGWSFVYDQHAHEFWA